MEVFEVDDLPLWIVIVLCGWCLSFLIGESFFPIVLFFILPKTA